MIWKAVFLGIIFDKSFKHVQVQETIKTFAPLTFCDTSLKFYSC